MNEKEIVTLAAITHDGKIYTGRRHHSIIVEMLKNRVCKKVLGGNHQGFVTSTGRFVSRSEAMQIALAAGQVEKGKTFQPNDLFSEDFIP